MLYILFLILSCISINGAHTYLLTSQRDNRKRSISSHATKDKKAYSIYLLGHLLGGSFFLCFAFLYFPTQHATALLVISVITVLLEFIQAFIPDKENILSAHTIFAYSMWVGFIIITFVSTLTLDMGPVRQLTAGLITLAIISIFVVMHFRKSKIYQLQHTTILLFFITMLVATI